MRLHNSPSGKYGRSMTQKLTLKDIAALAKVSEMTASRALRDAQDVSKATRERVLQAAKELGYVRNKIAGSLASSKVDLVGVVIPSVKSYVFSEVLEGISNILAPTHLRPVFGISDYDLEAEEDVIREMLSWRPSGLIVAGLEHTEAARRMMANADVPIIEIMDTDGEPVDFCVGISHHKAGKQMAAEFLSRGYKNIGFVGTKMDLDFRARKRLEGFEEGLAEAGHALTDQEQYLGGSTFEKGRDMTAALKTRSPQIDAIYYSTDTAAVGGLLYAMREGISVPGDLALAGFNGLPLAQGFPTRLATTDSMRFEIGHKAAEIILAADDPEATEIAKVTELPPRVEFGDSL